ncbi:unnamed protein product [Sphagnum balticum]
MRVHNEGAEEEEDLFQWDRDQVDVKHKVKSRNVGLELWVIHKILYAEKGTLTSGDSRHGSAGANTNVTVPAGGPPLGANAEFDANRVIPDEFAVLYNKVRHFAFKAIHASYDFSDNSVQLPPDAVGATPITRGEDEEDL